MPSPKVLIMFLFATVLVIMQTSLLAQNTPTQNLKGQVLDKSIKTALVGASIECIDLPNFKTISTENGQFKISGIPVGRHSFRINYLGYKTANLSNLLLESGKELELLVEMDEQLNNLTAITVKSSANKVKPINEFSLVSARKFSVEETRRFAAGINDPSRIAMAFAGVQGNGNNNSLIIRGNAPNGLLWRMEGIDIPNPNHFAAVGTSGGGISILSAQLLANSDFMTGAFPAEYGNALSGVFDIRLRKGNKDKKEHTLSASTIGVDLATEGYFKKGYEGSYLVNYRYGFLTLMQQFGLKIGEANTKFQDLSFNLYLPVKKFGVFTVFGFGGLSSQNSEVTRDSLIFLSDPSKRSASFTGSNTGALGFTHSIQLGKKTLLRTIYSINANSYNKENTSIAKYNSPLLTTRDNEFQENNAVLSMTLTHKFNKHHLLKTGFYTTGKGFDLHQREAVANVLKDKVKTNGNTRLSNAFMQYKYDPNNQWSFQAGLHAQYFALNSGSVIEPRAGIKYQLSKNQFISAGFGLHSQIQPLGNYFARIKIGTDTLQPNTGLDFSRSAHYVLGYAIQFAPNWNMKTEWYYQWLYQIPITAESATNFSVLNMDDDYAIERLNNKGNGKNYGMEITVERFWNDQFYLLSSLSLFQSKYLPSDGIWRNTRFNTNTSFTLATGKEWNLHGKRSSSIATDLKVLYSGGPRVTPIDLPKSIAQKKQVVDNNRIYEDQLASFFRVDFQIEWKTQYQKRTGTVILGVQNLFNRKNPISQSFDAATNQIKYNYLLGLIPVLGYKVDL